VRRRAGLVAAGLLAGLAGGSGCRDGPEPGALFAEAERLRLRYEKQASRDAIAGYEGAMAAWERAGDRRRAAQAGQRIALTHEQLGSLHECWNGYRRALPLARESGDRRLESEILSELGIARAWIAEREEQFEEARAHCRRALDLSRGLGAAAAEARALDCLGEVACYRQRQGEALELYREAGRRWEALGDRRGEARALLYEGHALSDLSRLDEASACFERARSRWSALGDRRGLAITLVAEGRLLGRRGEYQEAVNRFTAALALLEPMGDVVWEGSSLTGLARVYLDMGETRSALEHWERAAAMFEAAVLPSVSADVLVTLGETYLAAGDETTALARLERALRLGEEMGIPRWQAIALRLVGVVELVRGRPGEGRSHLERALALQRSPGSPQDPRVEAQILADLGEAHDLLGEPGEAGTRFDSALTLGRAGGDRVTEARALFGLARSSAARGDLAGARRHVEGALAVVESLRTDVESRDLRASYFASVQRYHELHVDVLMRLHRARRRDPGLAAAAFEASERARARSLLDSLAEAGVDLRAGLDPGLLKREQALSRAFADWSRRRRGLSGAPEHGPAAVAVAEEYRELEQRHDQLQAEIRSKSPRYAALAQPRPLRLREVQNEVLDRRHAAARVRPRRGAELPVGRLEPGPEQLRAGPTGRDREPRRSAPTTG
jgi:tetratricopeptide (TPR) repeat protein